MCRSSRAILGVDAGRQEDDVGGRLPRGSNPLAEGTQFAPGHRELGHHIGLRLVCVVVWFVMLSGAGRSETGGERRRTPLRSASTTPGPTDCGFSALRRLFGGSGSELLLGDRLVRSPRLLAHFLARLAAASWRISPHGHVVLRYRWCLEMYWTTPSGTKYHTGKPRFTRLRQSVDDIASAGTSSKLTPAAGRPETLSR